MPEVQKKATFEERVLITEERISVDIPEEIPPHEGTLKTDNTEKLVLCLQVYCSNTKIKTHKNFVLVIFMSFVLNVLQTYRQLRASWVHLPFQSWMLGSHPIDTNGNSATEYTHLRIRLSWNYSKKYGCIVLSLDSAN